LKFEHNSEWAKIVFKTSQNTLWQLKYGQVNHIIQLKKQNQTDDQASKYDTSQIHDLDQIYLFKNLKVKDVHSNNNKIRARARQAHGCLSRLNMK
jgi:hypothetical protein